MPKPPAKFSKFGQILQRYRLKRKVIISRYGIKRPYDWQPPPPPEDETPEQRRWRLYNDEKNKHGRRKRSAIVICSSCGLEQFTPSKSLVHTWRPRCKSCGGPVNLPEQA